MTASSSNINIDLDDLLNAIEPLIRRVVREELNRVAQQYPATFNLKPDSPLYADLEDILERQATGDLILHSHQDVWNE